MTPRIAFSSLDLATPPRMAAVAALGAGAAAALWWAVQMPPPASAAPPAPLPVDEMVPANVRPLAPAAARAVNARVPVAPLANPAPAPFRATFADGAARMRSLDCLTQAIYYEAANEPPAGQKAVAQIVLNRVRHRDYPDSVCGVVYQGSERRTGCQFTFTCDGSLARRPSAVGWARARKVAEAALRGETFAPVGYSTHYHADYVVPYWSGGLLKTAMIGRHIFYRIPGSGPSAFSARYAGVEPAIGGRPAQASPAPPAAPAALEDQAGVTFIDFDRLKERPPEEKAEELDRFGLLDRKAAAPPASIGDADAEAAIRSALAPRAASRPPSLAQAAGAPSPPTLRSRP